MGQPVWGLGNSTRPHSPSALKEHNARPHAEEEPALTTAHGYLDLAARVRYDVAASVHLLLRPAGLPPSLSRAFDSPLGTGGSLHSAGVCYRALRRLPGQDLHLLEQRVFQDAPWADCTPWFYNHDRSGDGRAPLRPHAGLVQRAVRRRLGATWAKCALISRKVFERAEPVISR
jgi:hypothetical protein